MSEQNMLQPFAEFQSLPLSFIIAEPLNGVIKAHMLAAQATREYIETMKDDSISFKVNKTDESGTPTGTQVTIEAPLLAMLPVPNLHIDSFSVNFRYEIRHTLKNEMEKNIEAKLKAGTTGWLKSFVDVSLSGAVSSRFTSESEINRSGTLEISLQASEAEMPEGLRKILTILSNSIGVSE